MTSNARFRSVVIFGGAGFIGCNWAHWLLRNSNAKVHVFDNLSRPGVRHNLDWLQQSAPSSSRVTITVADVRNVKMVESAVRHATEIYHLAAQVAVTSSLAEPRHDFEVNVGGTLNILEAARRSGRKPFMLFTSTNKVYGSINGADVIPEKTRYRLLNDRGIAETQPLDFFSPYGCSKGAADQYVHDYSRIYHLPTVVFRMSCIAGPRQFGNEDQGWVAHFLYSALQSRPVTIYGDGRQVRDVLHVDDLLRAFELARTSPAAHGEVFNVGGGPRNAVSLLELTDKIQALTKERFDYVTTRPRPGDQLVYVTNHQKLSRLTGWRPEYSVDETLHSLYDWRKRNKALFEEPEAEPGMAEDTLAALPEAA
ncbi:MAG: GDP-mannose 4,6-dehydratase [Acidobacteriales bacterium]|nr:GDP-mannose 4,6-dehydratase [Terriglobales bacterium]